MVLVLLWLAEADHVRVENGLEVDGVALVHKQIFLADFCVFRHLLGLVLDGVSETVESVHCLLFLEIDKTPLI